MPNPHQIEKSFHLELDSKTCKENIQKNSFKLLIIYWLSRDCSDSLLFIILDGDKTDKSPDFIKK